ncbi:MAG: ABC transporter permease subunit [Chloroflexi bacterium]|nr:ABC transporter permease subunit [Chloroflexota bacterium]
MTKYILHRFMQMIPLIVLVSVLAFALLTSMPGDPLDTMLEDNPDFTFEDYMRLRAIYGLDDPVHIRYFKWAGQLLQGNLGYSRQYKIPVQQLVLPRLQNTLILSVSALVIALSVALALGIISAVKQYSPFDYASMAFAFIGFSLPNFWFGLMLIVLFSVNLHWLPPGGIMSSDVPEGTLNQVLDRGRYLIMPVVVTAFAEMASWTRYTRNSLLDVLQLDYLRTARSKGLTEQTVIVKHALKNSLLPLITAIGQSFNRFFSGAVIVETVFSYPGMGKLLFDSVMGNDFVVSMAILLFLAFIVMWGNLIADVLYGWVDPRIRYD